MVPSHNTIAEDDMFFEQLRQQQYRTLDNDHEVYLDYTGGNLCPELLVRNHSKLLLQRIMGNPHSANPASQRSTALIENVRRRVLDFFDATDYCCAFTPNATGALKIVAESYPFDVGSKLLLLSDNHNSVNGIREFCHKRGGTTHYIPVRQQDLELDENIASHILSSCAARGVFNLFAYPAQSNASGVRHDLQWIKFAQSRGYHVLLDAAALVPTSKLDLTAYTPDFVSVSFYKMFGYPTGVGCLLIRKSVASLLAKPWFAGGTVDLASVIYQSRILKDGVERFEDGTLNYHNIPAIAYGLDYIDSIGIERISNRVSALANCLVTKLRDLAHDNGQPLVKIFGSQNAEKRSGTMMMNFFDPFGTVYPLETVETLAEHAGISIRSGCFCNPGIDEINNGITFDDTFSYFQSTSKVDYHEMCNFMGVRRGAIRVSVGIPTNTRDLDAFVGVAQSLKNRIANARPAKVGSVL